MRHTASSPAHLRVAWTDRASDEAGYRIWRREAGAAQWYLAGEVPANRTHFDDGGMQHETGYQHKVAAFNPSGESAAAETAAPGRTPRMTPHLMPTIVRRDATTFAGAPSALGLRDGRLLLFYFTGELAHRRQHMNQHLWQTESADGGATWSEARLVFKGGLKTIYGKPALARLPDGSIGLRFSEFGLDAQYKIVDRARRFVRSTDDGATWSPPVDVSATQSANNDTLILGDRGRILQAISSYDPAAQIAASDDLGATWRVLAEVKAKALPTGETALAHAGGGRIVFLSRHEAPFYFLSFSSDNGQTWGSPGTLYLGGGDNPPKLARIPGTDVLVAVVHSWYVGKRSKDRRQLGSVISRDGGRTWDNFRLLGHSPDGKERLPAALAHVRRRHGLHFLWRRLEQRHGRRHGPAHAPRVEGVFLIHGAVALRRQCERARSQAMKIRPTRPRNAVRFLSLKHYQAGRINVMTFMLVRVPEKFRRVRW